jgi:hypothetical protein
VPADGHRRFVVCVPLLVDITCASGSFVTRFRSLPDGPAAARPLVSIRAFASCCWRVCRQPTLCRGCGVRTGKLAEGPCCHVRQHGPEIVCRNRATPSALPDFEDDRRALRDRLALCAEENVALREAALLWIALYEGQVNRANTLAKTPVPEARKGQVNRANTLAKTPVPEARIGPVSEFTT